MAWTHERTLLGFPEFTAFSLRGFRPGDTSF